MWTRNLTISAGLLVAMLIGIKIAAQEPATVTQSPANETASINRESVVVLLGLSKKQIAALDQLYDRYARVRLEQEARISLGQDQLKKAQEQLPPDEAQVARLMRDIKDAEQRIAVAFVRARADALRSLLREHRAHLETLPANASLLRDDKYRQLLAAKAEEMWKTPVNTEVTRRLLVDQAYNARSPQPYRYYSAPYYFHSYGYRYYGYGPQGHPFVVRPSISHYGAGGIHYPH